MARLFALCITLVALSLGAAPAAPATHILFIGNSLTYSNDMPALFRKIAAAGDRNVEVTVAAFPDFALEDHLRDARTVAALEQRAWDVVVLQQGPSALESSRRLLLRDARAFADRIRQKGKAKIAFLMVWPAQSRAGDFPRVAESYRMAAEETGAVLVPAGTAWQSVLRDHTEIPLYAADAFHPSPAGSLLAALTLHRTLIGPIPADACSQGLGVRAEQCRALVEAADRASAECH